MGELGNGDVEKQRKEAQQKVFALNMERNERAQTCISGDSGDGKERTDFGVFNCLMSPPSSVHSTSRVG